MAASVYDYGNLLAGQRSGNYRANPGAGDAINAALGNVQNWAATAGATASSSGQVRSQEAAANAAVAQAGINAYGETSANLVNAYGNISSAGLSAVSGVEQQQTIADAAIKRAKLDRQLKPGGVISALVSTGAAAYALANQPKYGNAPKYEPPAAVDPSAFQIPKYTPT